MAHETVYKPGQWLFECDRCAGIYHSEKSRKEWTGAIVCTGPGTRNCWEPRHPQDFVRTRAEDFSVRDARPRKPLQYISDVYPNGVTADDL